MSRKSVVFLVCTGLEHINRGYESFTRECFDALAPAESFELFLVKGSGTKDTHELVIPCFRRNGKMAALFSRLLRKNTYYIEQLSFLLGMIPALVRRRPALIYYSDFLLGTWLWQLRRVLGFEYKLLFSNGAPNGPPFTRTDHIQQLLPLYIEQACAGGTAIEKQTLLPYAINVNKEVITAMLQNKAEGRKRLGLPAARKIVISVGAVNSHHKRMDYVIREFALLPAADFFLVILGQIDAASGVIIELANELLPQHKFLIQQVSSEQVKEYMCVADYFILASVSEGLPRVLPEALSTGLLPIVHDYAVTRQTLGNYGIYRDLQQHNQLAYAIAAVDDRSIRKEELLAYAYETYSWEALHSNYQEMIKANIR